MHLLAAQPGGVSDGSEAVDLGQTPGDVVVISAADTELSLLAAARAEHPADGFPSLRLANLMHLGHNMSVDMYVDAVVAEAKLVVLRLLGGRGYWPYGCEEVARVCRERNIPSPSCPATTSPTPSSRRSRRSTPRPSTGSGSTWSTAAPRTRWISSTTPPA